MQLTKIQKIIIIFYALSVLFLSILSIPYIDIDSNKTQEVLLAYAPIWVEPHGPSTPYFKIDYKRIILEIFALTVIFSSIFLVSYTSKAREKNE